MEGEERCTALDNDAADKKAKEAVGESNLRGDERAELSADNTWVRKVAAERGRQLAAWPATHQLFGELELQQNEVALGSRPVFKQC